MSNEQENDGVKYPTTLLFRHILTKGLQVGSLFGSGVLLPALYFSSPKFQIDRSAKFLTYSVIGGVALSGRPLIVSFDNAFLSGAAGLVKYVGMDQEGLEDRAYRIKYNEAQNRLDRLNTLFGLFGAGDRCFSPLLQKTVFLGSMGLMHGLDPYFIVAGFSLGTSAAVLAHFCTAKEKTDVGKIVHELKY